MTTIFQAEMAGEVAGLSSKASRNDVPPEFAARPALMEAWQDGFDRTRQAFRGVPIEASKKVKKVNDPAKPSIPEPEPEPELDLEPEPELPKTMKSILFERHPEAREYA